MFFFFFQAEDGIRDLTVTGVQTCALPISAFTSSRGDSACASCHIFGDFDGLAWDLGDPDNSEIANNGIFTVTPAQAGSPVSVNFRPMKGPMTTQSLRGLDNHGAMHWRGDRLGKSPPSAAPE